MDKVVIARAVIAGHSIARRLNALNVPHDTELLAAVGDLAKNLASLGVAARILDGGLEQSIKMFRAGRIEEGLIGLDLIKEATEELISEEDTVIKAFTQGEQAEVAALLELLAMAKLDKEEGRMVDAETLMKRLGV